MPALVSHIQMEWQWPEFRTLYERLAENRKLVRYDRRGTGLSERNVTDYPLNAHVLDLEAVVDCLGLERFALLGALASGPAAIAYAARHPERVSHLALWCTWARGSDYYRAPQARALISLIDKDWEVYTESAAQFLYGWSAGEEARQTAAYLRECITQEALLATHAALRDFDVTALLPEVRSPTLILHRRQAPYPGLDVARGLASRITGARLALLEGSLLFPHLGDMESVLYAIDEFLSEGEEPATGAAPSGLVTILFTDVEGSTALTQRLGDARARDVLRGSTSASCERR
jgi:pimeloyl-ACP methyl ester carboxylesterase